MLRLILLLSLVATAAVADDESVELDRGMLRAKVKELEQTLEETEGVLTMERRKVEVLARKALDLENQLAEALKKIAEYEANLLALKKELQEATGDLASARIRIGAIEGEKVELEKRIEATREALAEMQRRKAEADARLAEFRDLLGRFRTLIDAGKLRVKIVEGRMVVEVANDVLFASGSASLSRDGRSAVQEVAAVLAELPDRKFQIEGHTDDVPISTAQFPSNWELASARAITVVKTMIASGMLPERISAASFADVRPAMPNDTAEGKRANRRIEIVLVPDLSSLPGFDELNRVAGGE